MFEKSKSAITFKEFQNTLNVINNFDNEWVHFCDPDNNNNINNIIQNNFYQYKKEIKKFFSIFLLFLEFYITVNFVLFSTYSFLYDSKNN